MKKFVLPLFIFGITSGASAQNTKPLYEAYFSHPGDMVNNEDGPGYHFKVGDTIVVSMSDDGYYKMSNDKGQVLEEGDTEEGEDNFQRHGEWIEYYSDGKMRTKGSYFLNKPYGHWQFFAPNGNPISECDVIPIIAEDGSTAFCKAGLETVYYENGKIKEERYYQAEPYDSEGKVQVEDPETGKKKWQAIKVKAYRSKPYGTWVYYDQEGKVEKREDKKG